MIRVADVVVDGDDVRGGQANDDDRDQDVEDEPDVGRLRRVDDSRLIVMRYFYI